MAINSRSKVSNRTRWCSHERSTATFCFDARQNVEARGQLRLGPAFVRTRPVVQCIKVALAHGHDLVCDTRLVCLANETGIKSVPRPPTRLVAPASLCLRRWERPRIEQSA